MVTVISGISLWAQLYEAAPQFPIASAKGVELQNVQDPTTANRLEVLKLLDRLATHEHYYRSVYGRFTRVLGQLGVEIPDPISRIYEIQVQQANADRFLLSAFSESRGAPGDLLTVDHLYRVQANFPLPEPDLEYLKAHARKQLRDLLAEKTPTEFHETGIFRGLFRYSIQKDSSGRDVAVALGIRPPVAGVEIEEQQGAPQSPDLMNALEREAGARGATGEQRQTPDGLSELKEIYLAQKIFRGEKGRYAESWAELSKIAGFHFPSEAKLRAEAARLPASERQALLLDIEPIPEHATVQAGSHSLVIEPIPSH